MAKTQKLTEHFTVQELTTTDQNGLQKTNTKEGLKISDKLQALAEFAEEVRAVIQNCPMVITSGYRCEKLNKAIGGSKTSEHLKCEAIDFIPKKMSAFKALGYILISELKWDQLILEKRGQGYLIHISMGDKREVLYSPKAASYVKF